MYYREDLRCTLDEKSTQGIEYGRLALVDNQHQQTQLTVHLVQVTQDPSSFLLEVSSKNKKRDFDSFYFSGWEGHTAVTDAKVMTFTTAKCGHNLPQTSLLLRKVIPTSNQKKKIGCAARPPAAATRC